MALERKTPTGWMRPAYAVHFVIPGSTLDQAVCGRPFIQHCGGLRDGFERWIAVGLDSFRTCTRCARLVRQSARQAKARPLVSYETEHVFGCDRCKQRARTTPAVTGVPRLPKGWLRLDVTASVDDPDCVQAALGAQEFDELLICSTCVRSFKIWRNFKPKRKKS